MRGTHSVGLAGFSVCFLVNALGAQPLFLGGAIPLPGDELTSSTGRISCPRQLIFDDLNGDGLPELLVAYVRGVEILIGLSEHPGVWSTPEPVAMLPDGFTFIDITTGDMNGDGLDDIAYCAGTNEGGLRFGTLLAEPNGLFTEAPALEFDGSDIGSKLLLIWTSGGDFLSVGDVTGDGAPDLVVPGEPLFVLAGDGEGGFGNPEIVSSDISAGAALFDADNDGVAEILSATGDPATFESRFVLWRREAGGWAEVSSIDGAGRLETFHPSVHSISFSDETSPATGTRAYVVDAGFARLLTIDIANDGTMAYGPSPSAFGPTPFEYGAIGDVLGGPAPDLVLADGTAFVDLTADGFGERVVFERFHNRAISGGFGPPQGCRQIVLRDVNADGNPDVILADPQGIRITYGDRGASGEKALPGARFVGALPGNRFSQIATEIGDLNGDGLPDIVSASDHARVTGYIQRHDGSFEPVHIRDENSTRVHLADVDSDGRDDILTLGEFTSVDVRFSEADGSFAAPLLLDTGGVFVETKTGDLNGDGNPEIVAQGVDRLTVFERTAERSFEMMFQLTDLDGTDFGVAVGDINGDGIDDIVTGGGASQAVYTLLISRGDGTFELPAAGPSFGDDGSAQSVALGDLDGDGDLDLAVAGGFVGSSQAGLRHDLVIYENDGSGSFANEVRLPPNGVDRTPLELNGEFVRMADADGDGDLDLFVSNNRPGVDLVLNQGSFGFTRDAYYSVGVYQEEPAFINQFDVADVTGDGRPDIVLPDAILPLDATNDFEGLAGVRIFPNIATPRTICPADFADPAGELGPADLSAFVAAFLGGNPDTDLAAPFGILDLDDIAAFVTVFVDGCG